MLCSCFKRKSEKNNKKLDVFQKKTNKTIEKQISGWMKEYSKAIKILLLGSGESGKTTILKQMKILHTQGFNDEEIKKETKLIRINLLEAIKEITVSLKDWDPNFEFDKKETYAAYEFIEKLKVTYIHNDEHFVFGENYFNLIKTIWLDKNVQNNFPLLKGFSILDSAKHFLDKIDEISKENYLANEEDILKSRRRTAEIQKLEFEFKVPTKYGGGSKIFWFFDVGGQKGERRKWIQVFEGISAILFLVSSSEFDMKTREYSKIKRKNSRSSLKSLSDSKKVQLNRISDSLALFKDICESRFLECCGIICFLNKQDQLRDKIINKEYKLSDYFSDYDKFQYEPKTNISNDNVQEFLSKTKNFHLKNIFKTGKLSRQSSINSFNNLEPIRIPENNEDIDQSTVISSNKIKQLNEFTLENPDNSSLNSIRYKHSYKSFDSDFLEQVNPSLEIEYLKARCYIKNLFEKVAKEAFDKRNRKTSNQFGQSKTLNERECFFHYTIATDTKNIKRIFDDVHLMIILNNINQNMLV